MPKCNRSFFCALLLCGWPASAVLAQSQSSQQSSPPPQSQSQTQTPKKDDSANTDTTKKTDKPKPKKVYTEEDLSGMSGGVSVVGDSSKKATQRTGTATSNANPQDNPEDYWRGRARPILDAIAGTDQQIEQLREEIKKSGAVGFDMQTGLKDNIAYVHDRNAQIDSLQKHKAALQKQLDDLDEEGRKAGAQPAWFR